MIQMKLILTKAFIISGMCVIGFGCMALLIQGSAIAAFDRSIIIFVQEFETTSITRWMKLFTLIGSGMVTTGLLAIISFVSWFVLRHRQELLLFLFVNIGSACLNLLLKAIFQRARPDLNRMIEETGYSFPSGHSMAAFALYATLTFLLWRHVPTILGRVFVCAAGGLLVLAIGVSRIYLGVHYPSDVLGGYLASGALTAASLWYYQWYREKADAIRDS